MASSLVSMLLLPCDVDGRTAEGCALKSGILQKE